MFISCYTVPTGSRSMLLRKGGTCAAWVTGCYIRFWKNTQLTTMYKCLLTGNCILTDLPIKDSQFHTLTHWGELWEKNEGSNFMSNTTITSAWGAKGFPLLQHLTLAWRLSTWFHSGFAFFSIIWVQSCRSRKATRQLLAHKTVANA